MTGFWNQQAGGLAARRRLERGARPAKYSYVLRGRIRCSHCSRRMEGTPKHGREYYRCVARTLAPGSPALADHPKNVYLAERAVLQGLNRWIGGLFDRQNRDETVATLLACQDGGGDTNARQATKKRLSDAETRLRRLKDAIEAGADPGALVESINEAQAQRAAARAELNAAGPGPTLLSGAEVYAMIDSFGDVGEALNRANPPRMRRLYDELRLEMIYNPEAKAVDVAVRPLGGVVRVPEGGVVH
ncbi:MAG TPA: zinc ribbon domain-containing protein [Kribbella sp.]